MRYAGIRAAALALGFALGFALVFAAGAGAATIRVFAASSLTDAFEDLAAAFRAEHPGYDVAFNFGGSQVLRLQIEQGAEADVFASADHVHMDSLRRGGLAGPDMVFARNMLVVVTPAGKAKVRTLADLARPGARVVTGTAAVPVGRYTAEVLARMSRAPDYGADYARRVESNVVSREPTARAVLARVTLGEADAGFVYATDAMPGADPVRVIAIPESVNVAAEYPLAILPKSAHREAAARFVSFVLGERGQAILRARGFLAPR